MDDIKNIIENIRTEDKKVCVWGTGQVGTSFGYDLLNKLGIKVDFFCDSNEAIWGKKIIDDIECVDWRKLSRETLIFVMVSCHFVWEVRQKLLNNGFNNVVDYLQLIDMQSREAFSCQKKNQIAIYTCITGGYDQVIEGKAIEGCDYYYISDEDKKDSAFYRYIDIKEVLPDLDLDNTRKNRYCKINAHSIFSDYKYSIYHDGNIEIKPGIEEYIQRLPETKIITLFRPAVNNPYAEALRCLIHNRDDEDKFLKQVEKYWNEGLPEDFGLANPAILVRQHNHPICKKLMEQWWDEVLNYSRRDMVSLPYVLWKNGYTIDDVGTLSKERDCPDGNEWIFHRNHIKPRIE